MIEMSGFVLRSIRDILRWSVIKYVLLVGIPFMALWIWIGYELWDYAVGVTSMIIEWVPFSIVKANGAFFVIFFLWFVLVLVSFAVLTALVGPPLLRRFKEKTYYIYTFLSLMILSAFWALFLMAKWDFVYDEIKMLLQELPFQTVAEGFAAILAFFFFYDLFILTLYIVVSLFRKGFLEPIRKKEYPDIPLAGDKQLKKRHHGRMLWDIVIYLLLSILTIPVLFVPVANMIVIAALWAWLYRESYFLSTCNLYCTLDEYNEMRRHRVVINAIAIVSSLLNFLPAINVFTPFFAQIMFFHWIMLHKKHAGALRSSSQSVETEKATKEENPS